MFVRQIALINVLAVALPMIAAAAEKKPTQSVADFDKAIAPLLSQHCLECHSGTEAEGGLDLTSDVGVRRGGESGPAVIAGKPIDSLLWNRIADDEMPPENPLNGDQKSMIRSWIADGAKWGTDPIDPFRFTTNDRGGYDWWSLQPLSDSKVPSTRDTAWGRNPIDQFVLARLESAGLTPSAEADRRVLIRRLYFDLLGLPPSPADVADFVNDTSARAYERLVDRLLESQHYGERWARHWLDVVRFGESNGFERDLPRENAWPYRNWVVEALNDDMPYDRFVRMQIAGDALEPGDADALRATGFLVAGAHDTVLPANDIMRKTMAQDELEDLIGVVGQTFLGLTINCARCHDHKFDPISQKEYYQFGAALAGVRHGERDLPDKTFQNAQSRLAELRQAVDELNRLIAEIDKGARRIILDARSRNEEQETLAAPKPLASWDFDRDMRDSIGRLHARSFGNARLENGGLSVDGDATTYAATVPLQTELREKTLAAWVSLENLEQRGGAAISVQSIDGRVFDAIVFGEREPQRWMAGSNGFVRTRSFAGPAENNADETPVHVAIVYEQDGTITAYRNGKPYGKPYNGGGLQVYHKGKAQIIFGLRHSPPGGNRMLAGVIHKAQLFDRALPPEAVAASAGIANQYVSEKQIVASLTQSQRTRRARLKEQIAEFEKDCKRLEAVKPSKVYAVVSSDPGPFHVLRRGEVTQPTTEVTAAGIHSIAGIESDFGLPASASDRQRRRRLADWISDARNPLFARVIVNRIWHYHFGRGIVNTPNDFGYSGGRPSHPRLLDYLATELIRNRWSLKSIHRLVLNSSTYRQSTRPRSAPKSIRSDALSIDADNTFLWCRRPVRLDAESLRDSMLAVSGQLDRAVGGRGYRDVRSFFFKGTQFYEPLDDNFNRRTLYRFMARGGRNPFLDTFDCPDPSSTSPRRAVTTTPLQALALLNNEFVLRMSNELAASVIKQVNDSIPQQIQLIFESAYCRPASADEVKLATPFIRQHGLPAFCRVVFNSNEFIYVK